ncbi:hypothetical protein HC725_08840 [Vibrio sp. S17_S38]|uniref:hypothetical protein n=1 Tax=Vibrio sp. S17_S38 TaxID=2720229 RepID=UPI001681BF4A|nr:hypothetical protein [Vibrio sp. S17_S38]MBD1573379.1 hypothetical protein [Vibrio sp. S17_S38]
MEDTNKVLHENETSDDHQTDTPLPTEEDITDKVDEIKSAFNQVSKVITEVGQWSESTAQLFYLEVQRNIAATKQSIICQILFIPLLILFIFSLCISIGVVNYVLTQNVLIGIGLFLFAMILILTGLIYWQTRLIRSFGFKETISQLKEGLDVITKTAQSRD